MSGPEEAARPARFAKGYVWYVVFLLFLANVMNYVQRMVLSILLPGIKADIDLSDTQLGLLLGGGFALFYAIAGVPLARLADRNVRRSFLAGAIALWSVMTIALGLAQSFLQLLAARIGLGIGESICIPCSHSLLTDYVPPEKRPSAFGLHSTGAVAGITLSLLLGGYLQTRVGWRYALFLMALPGLLLALLIRLTLREPPRGYAEGATAATEHVSVADVARHLLSKKTYLWVLAAVCCGMLVEFGLNQWLPSYYVRQFGLSVSEVGFRYGLAVAAGGIPGSILGGFLTDRLLRRDVRWIVWVPAAAYVLAIPVGLGMLLASSAPMALLLNGFYVFLVFATNGAFWTACFVVVPPMMLATTSALTLLVAGVTGLALGPVLVGGLSDALASRAGDGSLRMSLVAVECLALGVVGAMWMASRSLEKEAAMGATR